jgi:hypothetical protein
MLFAFPIIVVLALFDLLVLFAIPLEFAFRLVTGWIFSIQRMAPGWQLSSAGWWWLGGVVLLLAGFHWFVRTFQSSSPTRWRWRTSFAVMALAWLAILAGMSLGGSVHQIGWLAGTPEPLVDSGLRLKPSAHLLSVTRWAKSMEEHAPSASAWQKKWMAFHLGGRIYNPAHLHFASHVVADSEGRIVKFFIWPRDGKLFREVGYYDSLSKTLLPAEGLPVAIREAYGASGTAQAP